MSVPGAGVFSSDRFDPSGPTVETAQDEGTETPAEDTSATPDAPAAEAAPESAEAGTESQEPRAGLSRRERFAQKYGVREGADTEVKADADQPAVPLATDDIDARIRSIAAEREREAAVQAEARAATESRLRELDAFLLPDEKYQSLEREVENLAGLDAYGLTQITPEQQQSLNQWKEVKGRREMTHKLREMASAQAQAVVVQTLHHQAVDASKLPDVDGEALMRSQSMAEAFNVIHQSVTKAISERLTKEHKVEIDDLVELIHELNSELDGKRARDVGGRRSPLAGGQADTSSNNGLTPDTYARMTNAQRTEWLKDPENIKKLDEMSSRWAGVG
ncbi:MAG: hypothetical protein ACRDGM_18110 [bacterium]